MSVRPRHACGLVAGFAVSLSAFAQEAASEPSAHPTPGLAGDAVVATVAATPPASDPIAPAAMPAASRARIDEIVVTATRRSENLQDVSIAVTALTAETMQDNVLQDVNDLGRVTPSLHFAQSPGQGINPIISLRGQVQNDPSVLTLDPSVGVYLDEVYLGRSPGSLLDMFDIERVEVLKGPQGTLYGRNTTGGAIRVIPKQADPGAGWDGFVRTGVGNRRAREIEGATNIPLRDDLAFRASVSSRTMDGWGKQLVTDNASSDVVVDERKVNDKDNLGARLSGVWNPGEALRFELLADYTDQRTNGASLYEVSGDVGNKPIPGGPVVGFTRSSDDFYTFASDNRNKVTAETVGAALKASYTFSFGTLKLIHARRNLEYHYNIDPDGTSVAGVVNDSRQDVDQDSTELQMLGDLFDGRLEYVLGVYDFTEDGVDITDLYATDGVAPALGGSLPPELLPLLGTIPIGGPAAIPVINAPDGYVRSISESRSAFLQLTFHLTDHLGITAGVRPIRDEKSLGRSVIDTGAANLVLGPGLTGIAQGGTFGCIFAPGDPGVTNADDTCRFDRSTSYRYTTYTAGLEWNTDAGVLLYAKTGRGARSGGQQVRGTDAATLLPFDPEFVRDYEIGIKGDYFGGRLRANLAAYHTDYSGFQITEIIQVSTVVRNAGDAKIDGAELEAMLAVSDALTLSASGSVIDFRFDDDAFVSAYAPEAQGSVTATWKKPVAFGEIGASVNYAWTGELALYSFAGKVEGNRNFEQDAYGLLSASAFVRWERYGLRLGVFGANLTGKDYLLATIPSFVRFDPAVGGIVGPGSARTFGLELVKTFGG